MAFSSMGQPTFWKSAWISTPSGSRCGSAHLGVPDNRLSAGSNTIALAVAFRRVGSHHFCEGGCRNIRFSVRNLSRTASSPSQMEAKPETSMATATVTKGARCSKQGCKQRKASANEANASRELSTNTKGLVTYAYVILDESIKHHPGKFP